jgi:predicted transcriptional regulator
VPTTQLTLSTDEELVRRLERLAAEQNMDVNAYVTRVLQLLARRDWERTELSPLTRRASGLAAGLPDQPDKVLLEQEIWKKHMGKK